MPIIDFIKNSFDYCSDCEIFRYKPPTPGSCPCCFSKMTAQLVKHGTHSQTIYTCVNDECRRACTGGYLSGFWAGWKEKERQENTSMKNIIEVIKEIQRNTASETDFKLKLINARCLDVIEQQKNLKDRRKK